MSAALIPSSSWPTGVLKLHQAPGNVSLSKIKTGLTKDSVANVSQILTLDEQSLSEEIGELDKATMRQIDEGIKLVLSL